MTLKNRMNAWLRKEKSGDGVPAPAPLSVVYGDNRRKRIIRALQSYMINRKTVSEIRDESELPYSKNDILDAISLEILHEEDDQKVEYLKATAAFLADFQKNVGPVPLTLLGISDSAMLEIDMQKLGDLHDPLTRIELNPDKEKYKLLREMADNELAYILHRLASVSELRNRASSPPPSQAMTPKQRIH